MKRILPLALCVMPISTLAATPSEILSNGEILASSTEVSEPGFFFYSMETVFEVAYKKRIYRCITNRESVSCRQLKDEKYRDAD